MDQALSDVSVLDLTHRVAGPACTKFLADYGADVVKVEPPWGDPARNMAPFQHDRPALDTSGLFLHLNTNKRGIVLDLKTAPGKRLLKELVADADILVESSRPGVMERLGLDYGTLRNINPSLIMTSISNFGQTGPYRDFLASDMVLNAMGGPMHCTGNLGDYPLRLPGETTQFQAGYSAAAVTMMAFHGSRRHGIGQHIDCSIHETQAADVDRRLTGLTSYQYNGESMAKTEPASRSTGYPCGLFPCADGFVHLWGGLQYFPNSAAMIGMPELAEEPRFNSRQGQFDSEAREDFMVHFYSWVVDKTRREFLEAARGARILSGALFTLQDVTEDPHFVSRGYFQEVCHSATGPVKYPGPPFKMMETPSGDWRPAPMLGQHTSEVLRGRLGFSAGEVVALRQAGIV